MKARRNSRLARRASAWGWIAAPLLLLIASLLPSSGQALKVNSVTVDLSTDGGGTWTPGVPPGTIMHPGDWVRVHLALENDTGWLGNAAVDPGLACPPAPRTCPPDPTSPTRITADPTDWIVTNNGALGDWPAQYWVWPSGGASCAPCRSGYYPSECAATLSLVSADPILTFDYNGYTYLPGAPNNTETVTWVFRIEQAACVDLDVYAFNQDDDTSGNFYYSAEGSYATCLPACGTQGDTTCHAILANMWGAAICPVPGLGVTAAAVVTSAGTRPAGVAYVGDTIEIRGDATNTSAAPVTVNPGDAYLSGAGSAGVCLLPFDPPGGCAAGSTEAGSPALPVTIGAGASRQFTWTTSVAGSDICGSYGGCTTGGKGSASGSASWTALITKSPATTGIAIQPAPIAITATVWVDPDGAGPSFVPIPLGVVTPGTGLAGPYYYMGKETIETRFTYRNTSAQTFDISPGISPGSLATELTLVAGPVPAGPQTLAPGASATIAWTWKRKAGGDLEECLTSVYGFDFTTAVRGNCFTQSVQARNVPFNPYYTCTGGCDTGSRNLTFAAPANVARGTGFDVVLHATNADGRPFVLDTLGALWIGMTTAGGNATWRASPPAAPYAWNPGETKAFTWTYSATANGNVQFETGIDFLAMTPPCHKACRETGSYCESQQATVRIVTPGLLQIAGFTATPLVSCANAGAAVVLRMNLKNTGPDCFRVTGFCSLGWPDSQPTWSAWDAASPPAPAASPTPAPPFTIPAGGTQLVTWYMDANCPSATGGGISFGCDTAAHMLAGETIDCGTKAVISPGEFADWIGTTPAIRTTQPGFLSASVWTDKALYSVGQVITVFLSVSNAGGNAASGFGATLTPNTSGGAAVSLVAGPSPAVPAAYPGSGQCGSPVPFVSRETFVWHYTALARGFVSFTAGITGSDSVCGTALGKTETSAKGSISDSAGLDCAVLGPADPVVTMPAPCVGCPAVSACNPATGSGCLDIVLAASNLGGVDVVNASVSQAAGMLTACNPADCTTAGAATPEFEPAEATAPGTIPTGTTKNYTWRYSPAAPGCLRAHVQVSGNDAATGAPLMQSRWGPCIRILPRYPVELTLLSAPSRIAPGQRFAITARVCNPGETPAGLQGGQPALQFVQQGGAPVTDQYDTNPPPVSVIPAHECREIAIEAVARRDASPGEVTIRMPQGSQYVAIDAATGLPVSAVDKGSALTIRVSDPRSRLVVAGPHPAHILREPALIEYVLADAGRGNGRLTLRLYTLSGELVRTLADKTAVVEDAVVPWDGRNEAGQPCASGVYLARIEAPGFSATAKVAIVK